MNRLVRTWVVWVSAVLWLGGCGDSKAMMSGDVESEPPLGAGEVEGGGGEPAHNGEPNNVDPNNTEPNNGEPNNGDPNNTEPNTGEPNNTEPNNTEPNNGDPFNNDDPNNTDPNDSPGPTERPSFESGYCTETVSACAGNPEGLWVVDGVCTDMSASLALGAFEEPACQASELEGLSLSSSGQIDIDSQQGRFEKSVDIDVDGTISVPQACRDSLDGCQPIEDQLVDRYGGATVSCSDSGGCDCSLSGSFTEEVIGDFEVVAGELDISLDGGGQQRYRYCVDGTWLHLETRQGSDHMPLETLAEMD